MSHLKPLINHLSVLNKEIIIHFSGELHSLSLKSRQRSHHQRPSLPSAAAPWLKAGAGMDPPPAWCRMHPWASVFGSAPWWSPSHSSSMSLQHNSFYSELHQQYQLLSILNAKYVQLADNHITCTHLHFIVFLVRLTVLFCHSRVYIYVILYYHDTLQTMVTTPACPILASMEGEESVEWKVP